MDREETKELTEDDIKMLDNLKKEIIRLGLQENPSRTKIQNLYNKNNMKSPNSYVYKFGSWKKALELIGMKDAYENKMKSDKSDNLKGKRLTLKWADMTREEVLDLVIKEIREKDISTIREYREKRDRDNAPSTTSIYSFVGNWREVMGEYKKRYGK